MSSLVILAAANIVAASPITPTPWFVFDDYPLDAVRFEKEGSSEIEIVVAPNGDPVACSISRSSGEQILDRRACHVAMRRPKFNPARNAALQPVYGTYRTQVLWRLNPDDWTQVGPGPEREIVLNRLPAGMSSPFYLQYALMVDESGRATQCAPVSPDHRELTEQSCAMLMKDLPAMPVAGPSGNVPAVRSVWVSYSL